MRNVSLICQLFLVALLVSSQSTAQVQPHVQNKNASKDHRISSNIEVPIISVDAEVISTSTGRVFDDLTHEDFIILENNVRQEVYAWQHLPKPLSLLIIVDTAVSDSNTNFVDDQVSALKSSLIDWLKPGDEVSIMAISERPIVLQVYTSNKQLINAALDGVSQHKFGSGLQVLERLSGGLQEATAHARSVQGHEARRAVILISNLPERVADELILPEAMVKAIIDSENIFFWNRSARLVRRFSDESKYFSLDKVSITDLVGLSGGAFINSDWKSFLERLRRRYRIVYLPFTRGREGEVVKIKLELKPSAKRGTNRLELNYPRVAIIPAAK